MKATQYRIDRSLMALIILVISAFVPVYYGSLKIEEYVQNRLISNATSIIGSAFDNMAGQILKQMGDGDIVLTLFQNEDLRRQVEKSLSVLVTPEIKYVYIVYRDEEGKFRFLADGSKDDKAQLGEKFDVIHEKEWIEAMETGERKVIVQDNIYTIGATYIKPIVQKGEVRALLVADFSVKKVEELRATLGFIRHISVATAITSLVFLYIAVAQYIKGRKIARSLFLDRLTGLPNRNYIDELEGRLRISDYYTALIDIDDFKRINATFGPEAGDRVIREVALYLRTNLKNASVIRYGGEEFLVILPRNKFTDDADAVLFFDRLRQAFKKFRVKVDGHEIKLTVSIGVNISPERVRTIEEAIEKADRALYRAKRDGKDRVRAYSEKAEGLRKRLSVSEIMKALEEERLVCYYQPIMSLERDKVSHYEALARMMTSEGDMLTPVQFLDQIKDTFAYTKMVKMVVEINRKFLEDNPHLQVSINLIPTDLLDRSVIKLLQSLPQKIRERMILEITEVEGIPSFERVKKAITRLRKLGFSVGIDDFGAGYSNLINLTQLQIDFLKIDGTIIKEIHKNKTSYLLTKMVNEFCMEMGIKVIAEYVENEKVLASLQDIGVEFGQGYLLGKPVPPGEVHSATI